MREKRSRLIDQGEKERGAAHAGRFERIRGHIHEFDEGIEITMNGRGRSLKKRGVKVRGSWEEEKRSRERGKSERL